MILIFFFICDVGWIIFIFVFGVGFSVVFIYYV